MKQLILLLIMVLFSTSGLQAQCTEDCVWPGDLNANGIANNLDVLALGFANGATGPARINMSTAWEPLDADDWSQALPLLGTNFKHCDADGNGLINNADLIPLNINYDQTNSNFTGLLGNEITGDDLFIVPVDSVAGPGGRLRFDIHLGTPANPVNNLYGIGFQLAIDKQLVADVAVDYTNSWIGQADEVLSYAKFDGAIENTGLAITRLDGTTVSGSGSIARVEIVITDVIMGLVIDSTACIPFPIQFKNVLGVDNEESDLMIRSQSDSLELKHPSLITSQSYIEPLNLKVYPNPTQRTLYVQYQPVDATVIRLYNSIGGEVYQHSFSDPSPLRQHRIPVDDLARGIYLLEVRHRGYSFIRKIVLK